MGLPVGELLARTTSRELAEWRAYEKVYGPLGPERGDWQAALVAYVVAAVNQGKKSNKLRVADFLLKWAPKAPQTAHEQLAILKALASATSKDTHDDR